MSLESARKKAAEFLRDSLKKADKNAPGYQKAVEDAELIQKLGDRRACGDCTACCTVLGVHEIPKRRQIRCEHLNDSGCGIYQDRPTSCRDFFCAWKSGLVPGSLRPDRSGLVFWVGYSSNGLSWFVDEATPGALDSVAFRTLARTLSKRRPLLVYQPNGTAKIMLRGVVRGEAVEAEDDEVAAIALDKFYKDLGIRT